MPQSADGPVDPEIADRSSRGLYRTGAVAALIAVVFFRRNFAAELIGFRGFGIIDVPAEHPSSAFEWFALLQEERLLGLALFDLIDLVNYALLGLIFLALYGALRRASRSAMVVATAFGIAGVAVYFASNQAFSMASLSNRYAAASSDAQRSALLAAGEALLGIHNPATVQQGTGIYISLFLVLLAGLIISIVMLRSRAFSRATAYVGIVANGIGLSSFIALAFAPALVVVPTVIYAPFRVIWYILIALALFRLGRGESGEI